MYRKRLLDQTYNFMETRTVSTDVSEGYSAIYDIDSDLTYIHPVSMDSSGVSMNLRQLFGSQRKVNSRRRQMDSVYNFIVYMQNRHL